jgi:hypothetical protein
VEKWIAREYFQLPRPAQHLLHHQVEEREALHLLAEHHHHRPVALLLVGKVFLPRRLLVAAAAVAHPRAEHLPLLLVLVERRMPEWMQVLVSNNAKQRSVNAIPVAKWTMIPLLPLARVVRRNVSADIINVSKSVLRPVAICDQQDVASYKHREHPFEEASLEEVLPPSYETRTAHALVLDQREDNEVRFLIVRPNRETPMPKKKPQKKNKKKKTPKPRNPYVLPARKRKAGPHKNKKDKRANENKTPDHTKEDA